MKLHEWQSQQQPDMPAYQARACDGKTKYFSVADAETAFTAMQDKGHLLVRGNVYRCEFCYSWHLGHLPYPVAVYPPQIELPLWLTMVQWARWRLEN